jgi:uncharacterized protein
VRAFALLLAAAMASGCAPQIYLAAQQDKPEYIRRLATEGADVELVYDGETPLVEAAMRGYVDAIKVLLDVGADINARPGGAGMSALMWAAFNGQTDAVKYLLERGADPRLKDIGPGAKGWTALDWARDQGRGDVIPMLEAASK